MVSLNAIISNDLNSSDFRISSIYLGKLTIFSKAILTPLVLEIAFFIGSKLPLTFIISKGQLRCYLRWRPLRFKNDISMLRWSKKGHPLDLQSYLRILFVSLILSFSDLSERNSIEEMEILVFGSLRIRSFR